MNKNTIVRATIGILLFLAAYFLLNALVKKQSASELSNIENSVAADAVKQYEIAKKGGDKIDIYTHASLVAAAFLQAKDSTNYMKWKKIEKEDAVAAGIASN